MRLIFVIVGVLVLLMGMAWALQGAWILPATFMRGPEWIAIGGGVAAGGALLAVWAWRSSPKAPLTAKRES